jgi:hypothetical protein
MDPIETAPEPHDQPRKEERADAADVVELAGDVADCFELGSSCDGPCDLPDCDVPCVDPGCF